ncbi:MAG: transporter [Flavobacteriaceae bacterium]|nr:transporter [Flavobacteriaceae bacterium]|tara:strand:+ start:5429 stop:6772 length:1344 start_codon:yes stop_codon:yes gene_type:complete
MKIKKLAFSIIFIGIIGNSQNFPNSLTLDQAIEYGLSNNFSVKNANREIEKAQKDRWSTIAIGLPQIYAEVNYQNFLEMPVSLVPAEFFGGKSGEFAEISFGTKQRVIGSVRMDQIIFDGSYIVGLEASKIFLKISENIYEKTKLETKKIIVKNYAAALLADENIKLLKKNKERLEENVSEIHQLFKNGFEEEESVEQIQLTLANINTQLKYAVNLSKIIHEMLKFNLGIPVEQEVILSSQISEIVDESNLIFGNLNIPTISNNIDIRIAENNLLSESLLYKYEKSKFLPSIKAFINGAYTGNNEKFDFIKNNQKWFGSSLFGLSLDIPLFSSFSKKVNSQKAKINMQQAETKLNETQYRIRMEIETALNEYQLAIENYFTEKENLGLAERIENKNQVKYFEGIVGSFELRQAQLQLYSSQSKYLSSIQNLIERKITLETLINLPNP